MTNVFHLANLSPWPVVLSLALLSLFVFFVGVIKSFFLNIFRLGFLFILLILITRMWWGDLKIESSFQGNHSIRIISMLKFRMIVFIISEVIFFVSFFWAFFHRRISPGLELGCEWPPISVEVFDPMGIPLLNSVLLLTSGSTVTWSHHSYLRGNVYHGLVPLAITIFLGSLFSFFQGVEYFNSNFSFSDSVYGSSFFLTTGFHGIHVMVGTIFLIFTLISILFLSGSSSHFIRYDLRVWYWHFVDVVWLFLYIVVYWWGSL